MLSITSATNESQMMPRISSQDYPVESVTNLFTIAMLESATAQTNKAKLSILGRAIEANAQMLNNWRKANSAKFNHH